MNLSTDRTKGVAIIRVGETKLMYPLLSTFAESITTLLANGETHLIIDPGFPISLWYRTARTAQRALTSGAPT